MNPSMASYNLMPMPYNHNTSAIDEQRWLSLVRSALCETSNEEDKKIKVHVSIFFVPKSLLNLKPEAFMPQLFALGPYHHWVPHLYDMERYKLAAARKIQCELNSITLEDLVCCFLKHEQRIRSHYHKYLDFTGETLAWMMVIDTSFLLDFLRNFTTHVAEARTNQQKLSQWDAPRMKMAYNMVTREVVMLENQIPLFLLKKILCRCRQFSSLKLAEEELSKMLVGFMKEVSPFKTASGFTFIDVKQDDHLLQRLYCMLVPKINVEEFKQSHQIDLNDELNSKEEDGNNPGWCAKKFFDSVWRYASKMNEGAAIKTIKRIVIKRPIKFLIKLPWKTASSFPRISIIKQHILTLLHHRSVEQMDDDNVAAVSNSVLKSPLVEEKIIPSVTELTDAGVSFMPSNGDLTTIRFDMQQKPATIYLPTVSLDMNTEVVIRNLVAYETSVEPGPMLFTRYTELMNDIIDTEEDVRILREKGIIVNRIKSDKEVADIWNGMSRCVRFSKVEFIDKFLEGVNNYYNNRRKVKAKRFIKKYVFASWQLLTFLATIVLLLLTCLQTFCNVYSCGNHWFTIDKD